MSHKADTPIYNKSAEMLNLSGTLIPPYGTELVDVSHPDMVKALKAEAGKWESDPTGGPTGEPTWTVGPVVDNKVTVEVQLFNNLGKKPKNYAGIKASLTPNEDGTPGETSAAIDKLVSGATLGGDRYKTTKDGVISFEISDNASEVAYLAIMLGGGKKYVSPAIDFNDPIALPTFESFSSPRKDVLRLEGTGFDGAQRFLTGHTNGNIYAVKAGAPDEEATNTGNGVTVIEWTDTVIEIESQYIPTGTILAVVLQANGPAYQTVAEWLNSNLDPVNGFAPFSVKKVNTRGLDDVSFAAGAFTATGEGFDNSVGLVIEFDSEFYPFIALDYSWYPGFTNRTATEMVTVDITDMMEQYGMPAGSHEVKRVWLRDTSNNADLGSVSAGDISGDDTYSNGGYTVDVPAGAVTSYTVGTQPGSKIVIDKPDGGLLDVEMVQVWWSQWSYEMGWSESTGLVNNSDSPFTTHTDTQIVVDLYDYYAGIPLYALGLVDSQGSQSYIAGGEPKVLNGVVMQ